MDRLWTPWRYNYVTRADATARKGVPAALAAWPGEDRECVFCNMLAAVAWARQNGFTAIDAERAAHIITMRRALLRLPQRLPLLNRAPAHPAVPAHREPGRGGGSRRAGDDDARARGRGPGCADSIRPDGLNMGINMGEAAGAGVAGHLHLHALPRWTGDASFMTTVGETRILPEALDETWRRLREGVTAEQPNVQT